MAAILNPRWDEFLLVRRSAECCDDSVKSRADEVDNQIDVI